MGKIYEFPEFRITFNDVKKEVLDLHSNLISLYMELETLYNALNVAKTQADASKDIDIDTHVHALHKISYLSIKIPDLVDRELELFTEHIDLMPFLEEYIKSEYGIRKDADFENFSFMDTYIKNEFSSIKNNFIVMRMIRAIKYYKAYNEEYYSTFNQGIGILDEDSLRDCISFDYTDIETLNTLNVIGATFDNVLGNSIYNKYQTIFSFVNPSIERLYLNYDFDYIQEYLLCEFDKSEIKTIKNKIVRTMIAIQKNKLVDQDDNNSIILHDKLTLKQALNILLHYNKYTSKYDNRFEELKNDYSDNAYEVSFLFAYLQQAYLNLDEQSINDLDHLFSVMTKRENNVKMGSVVLHKKIVEHFFDKDSLLKQKGIQRERKPLNNDKDE